MATIDLVVLGMIKQKAQSAYELQKNIEIRHVSYWVKISTSSIYSKVVSLEKAGYLTSKTVKEGNMPPKAIYEITIEGEEYLVENIKKISRQGLRLFIDYNAAIINMCCIDPKLQEELIDNMQSNIIDFKEHVDKQEKEDVQVPIWGKMIVDQQRMLADAMVQWIDYLKDNYREEQ